MYLLYADESGDLVDPHVGVFVVAGIAVHEDAVRPLAGDINGAMNRYVGKRRAMKLERHGGPLRAGAGPWGRIAAGKRHGLAGALFDMVCQWQHPGSESGVQPFAVAIDRNHSQSPTETAYGELLFLFDSFLRHGRRRGDPHNGVLVADRSRYEKTLQAWVELARARFRRPQQDIRRLYALAETPFFVDSRATRLMQLADLLAHALYRGYQAGDWRWANRFCPHLVAADPPRLVHFTDDSACSCPACAPPQAPSAVA